MKEDLKGKICSIEEKKSSAGYESQEDNWVMESGPPATRMRSVKALERGDVFSR